MTPKGRWLLRWSPRMLCLAFAVFLSLFALDVFSEGLGFLQTALALAMHLIPAAIVLVVLTLAWRWEWIGAALFVAAAALYLYMAIGRHHLDWALAISGPMVVLAGLFLLSWLTRSHS